MPSKTKGGLRPAHQPLQPNTVKDKIFNVLWELKKQGKSKDTIKNIRKLLQVLDKKTDLENPDKVLAFVANYDRKDGYKRNLIMAYEHYVKMYNLEWKKPKYHECAKMPKIPQESKINLIIANSPIKQAVAISMSRDTGLRPVELTRLTLRSLDLVDGIVYPETAKHGSPRALRLRKSTLKMLNNYLAKQNFGLNYHIFGKWNSDNYGKTFRYHRNKTAEKLQDPSIRTIRLYDLRHHFATMTYHKTKDILFTKQQIGHRKIETTLVYTQLLQFEKDENYTCKVARTIDEARQLIESGFEYVTEMEGLKLFRKRK